MLSKDGLNVAADQAIPIAHETCDAMNLSRIGIGIPPPITLAHVRINQELQSQGLAGAQVGQFKRDAIAVCCPDKKEW
jgi:hypothetical protein